MAPPGRRSVGRSSLVPVRKRRAVMRCLYSLGGFALLFAALAVGAEEPGKDKDKGKEVVSENATKAAEFAAVEALRYDIRHADKGKEPFKLLKDPVLRWSNPTNGEVHGAVYLWTHEG